MNKASGSDKYQKGASHIQIIKKYDDLTVLVFVMIIFPLVRLLPALCAPAWALMEPAATL